MKTFAFKLFVFAMLVGAMGVGVAKAQIQNAVDFKAPSSFIVGDTTLPAGSYTARPWSEDPSVLEISNAAGTHSVLVDTEATSSDPAPKSTGVVFAKYGNMLCMKQIVLANQKTGYGIISKHAEKKAAKAGPATKQTVAATAK
jgi:hypothetical protein